MEEVTNDVVYNETCEKWTVLKANAFNKTKSWLTTRTEAKLVVVSWNSSFSFADSQILVQLRISSFQIQDIVSFLIFKAKSTLQKGYNFTIYYFCRSVRRVLVKTCENYYEYYLQTIFLPPSVSTALSPHFLLTAILPYEL